MKRFVLVLPLLTIPAVTQAAPSENEVIAAVDAGLRKTGCSIDISDQSASERRLAELIAAEIGGTADNYLDRSGPLHDMVDNAVETMMETGRLTVDLAAGTARLSDC
ncbi:hypothetical protein AADZ90_014055 [Aestuariibius sp. 2305UL40-4]|uniref:hypothetical protein n=1 Tax=Aestuariibius violaceus TaxID=3234132 RepID=UPI00345E1197